MPPTAPVMMVMGFIRGIQAEDTRHASIPPGDLPGGDGIASTLPLRSRADRARLLAAAGMWEAQEEGRPVAPDAGCEMFPSVSAIELLRTYADLAPHLEALGRQMCAWIEARSGALGVQVVDMRVKSADSLAHKLGRPDKVYRRLEDVTDVLGLRVVTLFEDQVDLLAQRLQAAGVPILREHGIDKRKQLEPSTFGYRSLHVICTAPAELDVHPMVRTWPFEVQLR